MTTSGFRRFAGAALLAMAGAVAVPAAVLLATNEAAALLVLFPGEGLLRNMPEGSGLIEWNGWTAVIAGGQDGIVRDAYAAGAFLVLPVRKSSCADLQASKSLGLGATKRY